MALSYTLREGLAGFGRMRFAALTSTTALVVALVLIGMVGLLAWQGQRVAEAVQQRVGELQVYLEPADTSAVAQLQRRIEELPGFSSVAFVSQEEAAREFQAAFGDEAALFDEGMFLPASFRVRFQGVYATADSLAVIQDALQRWPKVDEVVYERALVENVTRNVRLYSLVGLAVGTLVILAALLLVGNTIRLSIYARRLLIRTMKLVGATDGFIRRPFLVEGLVQGLLAGGLAAVLVWMLYAAAGRLVEGLASAGWPGGSPVVPLGSLVLLGAALGLLASWIAVRTFIRQVRLS